MKQLRGLLLCGVVSTVGVVQAGGLGPRIQLMTEEAMASRLVPPGASATVHVVQKAPEVVALSPDQIYQNYCSVCHNAGVAGAPVFGQVADWSPRVSQGLDTLLQHVEQGYKAMPPKGGCMTCSEDDLKLTIEHMLEAVELTAE